MRKAFAYLRVSGKGQIAGDGFTRQHLATTTYAAANDILIVREFKELGVTGTASWEDRPALLSLMEALHSNGVRTVLIEKLDRLARDLMVQETIIADLRKNGFELISVREPDLCQDDPTRKLMRQLMGAIAEYEKSMLVLKLRVARVRVRAKQGHCEGRKRFGYYPGEAATVERMKAIRATGVGFDKIAEQLNAEGLKPRKGERWWGRSVNNTLREAS